jgi:hypothetical protein
VSGQSPGPQHAPGTAGIQPIGYAISENKINPKFPHNGDRFGTFSITIQQRTKSGLFLNCPKMIGRQSISELHEPDPKNNGETSEDGRGSRETAVNATAIYQCRSVLQSMMHPVMGISRYPCAIEYPMR